MANFIAGHMPAPHDCITLSVTRWFRDSWRVVYVGTPQQLVAAGVVDDDMVRKITSQKGGSRVGKDGMSFKLKSGRIPAHIQWACDEPVGFERKATADQLMKLPGVRELFPDGVPAEQQDDELTHEQLAEHFPTITVSMAYVATSMAERIGASTVRAASLRARCVGRRRRLAQWLSIGKVIAPNFVARGAA